MSNTAGK
ncbi:hypothetical protein VCHC41A1_3340, partial [Vibrio cholerae HC-41A1]